MRAPITSKATLLIRCLEAMEIAGLRPTVLHGWEQLPDDIRSDVDLLVDCTDPSQVSRALRDAIRGTNCVLVQAIQNAHGGTLFVLAIELDDRAPEFLQIDAASAFIVRGKRIVDSRDAVRGRRRRNGMWVVATEVAFLYYLTKKVVKRGLDAGHGAYLTGLYRESPRACGDALRSHFDATVAAVLERAASSGDWRSVRGQLAALSVALGRTRGWRERMGRLAYRARDLRRRMKRVVRPAGLLVGFSGVDGAGKSTVAARLQTELQPLFPKIRVEHWRPCLLGRGYRRPASTRPHHQRAYGPLLSAVKLVYVASDFVLGHVARILPTLFRGGLVVYDRYATDLLADPLRYRYAGPEWLARSVLRLVPQPAVTFVLVAPPSVAGARKHEVAQDVLTQLATRYEELARSAPNFVPVDASRGIDDVVRAVEAHIIALMTVRTLSREGASA